MYEVNLHCRCGRSGAEVLLTQAPRQIQPRACDCDFCRTNAAAWVSDAAGSLRLHTHGVWSVTRQGSDQAKFMGCDECGNIVAVVYEGEGEGGVRLGAINAGLSRDRFGTEITVSPRTLTAPQKAERWISVWFRDVQIRQANEEPSR